MPFLLCPVFMCLWLGCDQSGGDTIASVTLEPYGAPRTYDLLPDGDTGDDWANGVLLGSTLAGAASDQAELHVPR